MNKRYEKCRRFWDNIFSQESAVTPTAPSSGHEAFDYALQWLCEGSQSVLDFGCGNGVCLFYCALYGTEQHIGIDLSKAAIKNARARASQMNTGTYCFLQGGVEQMGQIEAASIDAVLLSNILDNLYPEDASELLQEICRVLRPGGKVFAKINPYLTEEQIRDWNVKILEGNMLDDGLLLWNNTTEEWVNFFSHSLTLLEQKEVYWPEYDQFNRFFLLSKSK